MHDQPIKVGSAWEEHTHVALQKCSCGGELYPTQWELSRFGLGSSEKSIIEICQAICILCGTNHKFQFDISSILKPQNPGVALDLERAWPPPKEGPFAYPPKAAEDAYLLLQQLSATTTTTARSLEAEVDQLLLQTTHRILGRFSVIGVRHGGMGTVYLCNDTSNPSRLVICKTIKTHDGIDQQALRREAEIWLTIGEHPNIVQLLDVKSITDDHILLILEAVPPGPNGRTSIQDWIKDKQLPASRSLYMLQDIVLGMKHCLSRTPSFVHGDLKPSNLLVDIGFKIKITDFGLARSKDIRGPKLGRSLGTPEYLAPECWQGAEATEVSDVYAFGLIAYEIIHGRHPFHGVSIEDLERRHRQGGIKLNHSSLTQAVEQLLTACLEIKPSNRPSFTELARILQATDRPHTALSDIHRALEANNRGTALAALGRHQEAVQSYLPHLDTAPEVLVNLAVSTSRMGLFDIAEILYKRALAQQPQAAMVHANYAAHILRSGQQEKYEEGIKHCDLALSLAPDHFTALTNKAALLNSLARHKEATEAGELAIQIDRSNPYAWFETAFGYARLGRFSKALKYINQALKVAPDFKPAKILKSQLKTKK